MRSPEDYLVIEWKLNDEVNAEGVVGIKSEHVHVDDLVAWAKRRRKGLRKGIADAHRETDKKGWRRWL